MSEYENESRDEVLARLKAVEEWVTELTEEATEMLGEDMEFFEPYGGKDNIVGWSIFMLASGLRRGVDPTLIVFSGVTAGIALEKRRAAQVAELNALTGEGS